MRRTSLVLLNELVDEINQILGRPTFRLTKDPTRGYRLDHVQQGIIEYGDMEKLRNFLIGMETGLAYATEASLRYGRR